MACLDFTSDVHKKTTRDYMVRVPNKGLLAEKAKQWGYDYWDGDRLIGYGGYKYDGRWRPVAEKMAKHYGLKVGDRVLDVGCGKGFLLYEFTQALPGISVSGLDVSTYAIEHAKPEVRSCLQFGNAVALPFQDGAFDFVVSLATLHNLPLESLIRAVREVDRVGKGSSYILVESWRNDVEKANLLAWQNTCESFFGVDTWEWIFRFCRHRGDWGFMFFE